MVWLKTPNMFIYNSIYMKVFVKTRKSGKHCLALKTKNTPHSNTQSSMQYSLWVKILLMLNC